MCDKIICRNCKNEIGSLIYRTCDTCGVHWCESCVRKEAFYCKCGNIDDTPENQELAYRINKEHDNKMENYEKIYNEFWKATIEPEDGALDLEQVKKELADYYGLIQNVTKVYSTLTNGMFSKVDTIPGYILEAAEQAHKEDVKDSIEDLIDCYEDNGYISVEDIRSYFSMEKIKNENS